MARAFPALCRRTEVHAFPDRHRQQELQLLERHRGADAGCGAVLPRHRTARSARQGARRDGVSDPRQGQARTRQDRLRRELRALSFEQGARQDTELFPEPRLRRPGLPQVLEQLLGMDQDPRVQARDDAHREGEGLPRRQLPLQRVARAGDPARDQRLRLAGDQRDPRRHLGQFLFTVLQEPALGGQHHRTPSLHRRAAPVRDAGGRARLHSSGLAGERMVDGALPAQQHDRRFLLVRLGGRPHEILRQWHRAPFVAGEAQGRSQVSDRLGQAGARCHRRDLGTDLSARAEGLSAGFSQAAGDAAGQARLAAVR